MQGSEKHDGSQSYSLTNCRLQTNLTLVALMRLILSSGAATVSVRYRFCPGYFFVQYFICLDMEQILRTKVVNRATHIDTPC